MPSPAPNDDIPPGYKDPLSPIDGNHHGAGIHICNGFGLTIILITLTIRAYIRTRVAPPWRYDDHVLLAATILGVVQCGITFAQVHDGFGTSIELLNPGQILSVQKLAYAADIFYILTLYTGKICVVLLFKRISADRAHQAVAWSIFSGCCVMGLVSVFLTALRCDLSRPWIEYRRDCPSLGAQWSVMATFDIMTEVALFLISILLVYGLHTKAKNKGRVILAFGIRLPIIAIIILRLIFLKTRYLSSPNPTLDGVPASILTQLEIFYNVITATVPCLRPFLAGFATNFGAIGSGTVLAGSQIGTGSSKVFPNNSKSGSFALSSLTSRNRLSALREKILPSTHTSTNVSMTNTAIGDDDTWNSTLPSRNETRVTRGSQFLGAEAFGASNRSSVGSEGSTKMIIKKEVQFSVGSVNGGARHLGILPDEMEEGSECNRSS